MSDTEEPAAKEAPLPRYLLRSSQVSEAAFKTILRIAAEALQGSLLEKDAAEVIKKAIDLRPELNTVAGKGPWQCVIGKSFASSISHEPGNLLFFDLPEVGKTVLVYKSIGVQSN